MALFSRWLTPSSPTSPFIAPHPSLSSLRSNRLIFLVLFGFILFSIVSGTLLTIATSGPLLFPWSLLGIGLSWLGVIGFSLVAEQWWKSLETARIAAAAGDQRFLAKAQPHPNPEALSVPVRIEMRLARKGFLVFGSFFSLLLIGLADGVFFITQWFQHLIDASIWWWLLALTVAAGASLLFAFLLLWRQRWIVEVHQEGLRSWVQRLGMDGMDVPFLSWQQARLFACYHKPGPWGTRSAWVYELSSPQQVVTWTWLQHKEGLYFREEPTLPLAEHQVQMQALCDLIAAKTGLPLHQFSSENMPK